MKAKEFEYIIVYEYKDGDRGAMKQINQGIKTVIDSRIHVMKGEFETLQNGETNVEVTNTTHCYLCKNDRVLGDSRSDKLVPI